MNAPKPTKDDKRQQIDPRKLPNQLIIMENPDKSDWHESWEPQRSLLNFPHPFRISITGPPNSGKSLICKNILMRAYPQFERVIIVYPGGKEATKEYDDMQGGSVEFFDEIPDLKEFPSLKDGAKKTLLILDDLDTKRMSTKQRSAWDRITGHVSTHRHCSVIACTQQFFNLTPNIRRNMSCYIIFKPRNRRTLTEIGAQLGEDLPAIFDACCTGRHDSVWVDLSPNSPAPLRVNGFTKIHRSA